MSVNLPYPNPHAAGCPWHDSAAVFGAPNIKWCEASVCHWVSEPVNTVSNLLYLVFAVVLFLQLRHSPHRALRWMPWAMALMGLMSGLYHASNFFLSQVLDFAGMFVLLFWFLVINLRRCGWLAERHQVPAYLGMVVGGVGLVVMLYRLQFPFQLLIAVLALAIVATEVRARASLHERVGLQPFARALAFIVAAQACSLADLSRTWCDPDNHFVQGHALWHVLSAIALYFAVQHYRSLRYP